MYDRGESAGGGREGETGQVKVIGNRGWETAGLNRAGVQLASAVFVLHGVGLSALIVQFQQFVHVIDVRFVRSIVGHGERNFGFFRARGV